MANNARDGPRPTPPRAAVTPVSPSSPTVTSSLTNISEHNNLDATGTRRNSLTSKTSGRLRGASLKFMESAPPSGFTAATGEIVGKAPTLSNIRNNNYGNRGITRGSVSSVKSGKDAQSPEPTTLGSPTIPEMDFDAADFGAAGGSSRARSATQENKRRTRDFADMVENGEYDLGRGKMDNQSYTVSGNTRSRGVSATTPYEGASADSDADSLDELDPKPKRRSKNVSAMLGEDMDTDKSTTTNAGTSSKRNTRDFADMIENGEYDLGRGKMDDQSYKGGPRSRKSTMGTTVDGAAHASPEFTAQAASSTKPVSPDASRTSTTGTEPKVIGPDENGFYPNGYHFPPKKTWKESTVIGLKASWKFLFANWYNWLIVLYGLNVVAWGGMLFLLLIGGGKAMCWAPNGTYNCDDLYSPRRIWVEIDSQILNALFCVTGFGLAPWRFRDLWYLMKWRVGKKHSGLRRLAGIHNGWFRLPGSQELALKVREEPDVEANPAIPIPTKATPPEPLTAVRAPATALWKMDFVVWLFVWNTFLQVVLSFFMWNMNRFERPSWSTGTFVAFACIVAMVAGITQFVEGNKIKKIEGVPLPDQEGNVDRDRDLEEHPVVLSPEKSSKK